ncbi:glutamine synthetase family protein [Pseudonocardia endophytica]|uniref:Glutamine synthetase n=1 Tax=Pseudonocardia endophytica TaxID=401976 RepID=A0A4V2PHK5_PSEEN|nr:glutamine synthetase [Pseudonocardia endophytica]TCK21076.1 glutamine synthetase [Pseudonocardia endophytica]
MTIAEDVTAGRFGEDLRAALADRDAFDRHRSSNTDPATVARCQDVLGSAVEFVYYMVPTIGGRTVAKVVPAGHLERMLAKGICFHRTALTDLQSTRDGDLVGGGIEAREFWGLPQPETLQVLPWDPTVARVFCRAYEPPHLTGVGGRIMALDTRALAQVAHEGFIARTGLELRSGLEPEMTWAGPGMEVQTKDGQSPAYQVENLERMRPVFQRVIRYARALGLDMIQGDYEDDGQLELNWDFDRADTTADRLITYRQICKQVARELGLQASFMPKPTNGKMGNGCHHNLSLWRGGQNVVEDGRVELHVTEQARQAIAGMLVHSPGAALVMGSTVNSYKRYWDVGQFAPDEPTWGLDNRGAAVRISSNGRMEHRLPDAAVNPYLSMVYLLASIEDGLARELDAGEPDVAGGDVAGIRLPRTLGEAIEAFRADAYLMDAVPAELTSVYLELKSDEWARFCGTITQWEFDQYWEMLP